MSLIVELNENKTSSIWKEYKDEKGNVLAEFKIRGIAYQAYQVAIERAHNQVAAKGFDVKKASPEDQQLHELLMDAAACHLIEDWKGVVLRQKGKEEEVPYTPENAMKLFKLGNIGPQIWSWVKLNAEIIQFAADKEYEDIVGKPLNSMGMPLEQEALPNTKKSKGKQKASK